MEPRTIAAGEFKDRCLKLMDEVRAQGVPLIVTKRGKPLVRIVPVQQEKKRRSLRGTVIYEAEDIFSTGEAWDAESDE